MFGEIEDILVKNKLIDAEYLITVNIAQSLKALNLYLGSPYQILLEHPTKEFATNCTPLILKNKPYTFNTTSQIRSGTYDSNKRSGKIDIAIYDNCTPAYGQLPLCAIEVKGFNPSKSSIIKDLERNLSFFEITSNTGNSTLPLAAFATIKLYFNSAKQNKRVNNLNKVKTLYESYLTALAIPASIE